jgi:hypothetical protein
MRDHKSIRPVRLRFDQFFEPMTRKLKPFSKAKQLKMAREFSQRERVPKPDRKCVRSREALALWFCQYAPDFPTGFPQLPEEERTIPDSTLEPEDTTRMAFPEMPIDDADWDIAGLEDF